MPLTAIPRTAVDTYVRLVRVPVDTALRLAGRDDPTSGPMVTVDRVDASVRGVAARVLRDPEMQQDATRRRVAADERARSAELESHADAIREQARSETETRKARATDRERETKERARKSAAERKRKASERAAQTAKAAERDAAKRTREAEQAETQRKEQLDAQAKKARLAELSEREEALDDKATALTAADEAGRLKSAAAAAKAERKRATT